MLLFIIIGVIVVEVGVVEGMGVVDVGGIATVEDVTGVVVSGAVI